MPQRDEVIFEPYDADIAVGVALQAFEDGGVVRKIFHQEGIVAWLLFEEYFYSPAEVEGLTVNATEFQERESRKIIPAHEVPPILFSEIMRDMDLVVSVAHRSGADPEASMSSMEMRRSLVMETASMLKLDNVRTEKNHILVTGHFGNYSIHLGSGIAHKLPGGAIVMVPVQATQRGRLFLPFADDDPKTAEVLSKTILLARDKEIKDASIKIQIMN